MNRFRVSSALPRKLEELGLSPLLVLRQAGLPMGLFNQDKILVSTEELFAFYRGLAEVSRDPAIGLKLGTEDRIRALRSNRDRRALHQLVSRCVATTGPLQAAHRQEIGAA